MSSMSTHPSTLFVRESDDFEYQNGTPGHGFRTTVYRHHENNMRVVLCRVPSPMCHMTICVPTIVVDNRGLPHTLEHLVLCGSQKHPNRGSLYAVTGSNFSVYTNGSTEKDQTYYEATAAGEEAIGNILPVFLDHVLNPLLSEDQFLTEVYHFDASGKERGVVFSEMIMRDYRETDLMSIGLGKLVYSEKSTYAFESGGLTKDIATLTNQDIIDYHRRFYDPNNITVLLVGSFSDSFEDVLQQLPADLLASRGCDSRISIVYPELVDTKRFRHIRFPSAEADTGSIRFDWRGPLHDDVETITAVEILLKYLSDGPFSPLRKRFVERPVPLCSSLCAYVKPRIPTALVISFYDVPYTDPSDSSADSEKPMLFTEGYFASLLIQELQRLYDSRFDGNANAFANTAKQLRQTLMLWLENNPLSEIEAALRSDVVAAHWSSGSKSRVGVNACKFDVIDKLAQKPIEFWLNLLKWFIDTPVYHVALIPDTELGGKLEQERRDTEQRNAASISDREKHTQRIERAVEASKFSVPDEVKRGIRTPDALKIASLLHTHEVLELPTPIGPAVVAQLIEVATEFPALSINIPLPNLPDNLRSVLTLFKELILATDLILPPGIAWSTEPSDTARRIDYNAFNRHLSNATVFYKASIGQTTDLFSVDFKSTHENLVEAGRLLIRALVYADFTVERIRTVSQKLLNNITYTKRCGDEVIEEVTYHLAEQGRSSLCRRTSNRSSVFKQERALRGVIGALDSGDTIVVDRLKELQRRVVNGAGGYWTFTFSNDQREKNMRFIDALAQEWQSCFEKFLERGSTNIPGEGAELPAYPFPYPRHSQFPNISKPLNIQVVMPTLQASIVRICCECTLFAYPTADKPFDAQLASLPGLDYYALSILVSLLQRSGGPLHNAIRSKGYGYTPFLWVNMYSGTFNFSVDRAVDASNVILEMRNLISALGDDWDKYITEFEVNLAKSRMICGNARSQSSPSRLTNYCLDSNLSGFASASQFTLWSRTHISAVTNTDLRRIYDSYLRFLVTPGHPVLTVVLTPPGTELSTELGEFEVKMLDEL